MLHVLMRRSRDRGTSTRKRRPAFRLRTEELEPRYVPSTLNPFPRGNANGLAQATLRTSGQTFAVLDGNDQSRGGNLNAFDRQFQDNALQGVFNPGKGFANAF